MIIQNRSRKTVNVKTSNGFNSSSLMSEYKKYSKKVKHNVWG